MHVLSANPQSVFIIMSVTRTTVNHLITVCMLMTGMASKVSFPFSEMLFFSYESLKKKALRESRNSPSYHNNTQLSLTMSDLNI